MKKLVFVFILMGLCVLSTHSKSVQLNYQGKSPGSDPDKAVVILEVIKDDEWWDDDGTGYVMLIGNALNVNSYGEMFASSTYQIPVNATSVYETPAVSDGRLSIEIPGGRYDYSIVNPKPANQTLTPVKGANSARSFMFENGWTYLFQMRFHYSGGNYALLSLVPPNGYTHELPFVEHFDTPYTKTQWKIVDANQDGVTWKHIEEYGHHEDGYMVYSIGSVVNPADDYLITNAPVTMPAGDYKISLKYSSRGGEESFEILYGLTDNVNELVKLGGVTNFTNESREEFSLPIRLTASGNYYFAIRATSKAEQFMMEIDDMLIEEGLYTPTPDLLIERIITPLGGCFVSEGDKVGFIIHNKGDAGVESFSIDYTVDGTSGNQSFNETIAPLESDTVYLTANFNWSELDKTYLIAATVTCTGDKDNSNNSNTASFSTLSPMETLPYKNLLLSEAEAAFYHPAASDSWRYVPNYIAQTGHGEWTCLKQDVPLYTDCFQIERRFL